MAVVQFPAAPASQQPDGPDVAKAVDRYLDGVQAATTRASYAETLACLAALVSIPWAAPAGPLPGSTSIIAGMPPLARTRQAPMTADPH